MRKPKIDKPEIKEDILLPFSEVEFFNKWQEWLLYRKQRRFAAYTPIGLNRTFEQLFKDAGGNVNVAIQIIDQSIGKSWQGLFALKNQQNGNQQQPITNAGLKDAFLDHTKGW